MEISFKIYKNFHKCKWVIRREKVTGVGLTVQRLRMGLVQARMWSMLRKLLKRVLCLVPGSRGQRWGKRRKQLVCPSGQATLLPYL